MEPDRIKKSQSFTTEGTPTQHPHLKPSWAETCQAVRHHRGDFLPYSLHRGAQRAQEWVVLEQEPVAWIPRLLLGGKKPGLNRACLLAGAAAMGKAQLAGCLDSSRACSLADSLTVHIWIRKDSLWRREGGSWVWLAPCLEESCLVKRGRLQSETGKS